MVVLIFSEFDMNIAWNNSKKHKEKLAEKPALCQWATIKVLHEIYQPCLLQGSFICTLAYSPAGSVYFGAIRAFVAVHVAADSFTCQRWTNRLQFFCGTSGSLHVVYRGKIACGS